MKKLTWLLMSLMLFLGIGTAFADEAETPATLPTPTFTPTSGATVEPGDVINFNIPENYAHDMVIFSYVFDNETVELKPTYAEVFATMAGGGTNLGYSLAVYTGGYWSSFGTVPADATGNTKMRVRMALAVPNEDDEDADPNMVYSEVVEATYEVAAEAPVAMVPQPTLDPASGEVESGTTVSFICDETPSGYAQNYIVYWVLNNENFDFTQYKSDEAVEDAGAKYSATLKITENTTITAAVALIDYMAESDDDGTAIIAWSEPVTATYTIKAVEPEPTNDVPMPVFNPDGGVIAAGAKVVLTNGTEGDTKPMPIYYTFKGVGNENYFVNTKTQGDLTTALNKTGLFKVLYAYEEGGIELTKNSPISAATADIDEDGNITWSTIVTKTFTIGSASDVLVAPTFNPNGGEIGMDEGIEISTTTAGARVYYDVTSSTFAKLKTEEELDAEESSMLSRFSQYSSSMKPSLEELGGTTPGAKVSISAAAVLIAADGSLTWSEVTTREFTVKAEEGPAEEVAIPVISPGNDQPVHMGDKVTITCATEGAEIYYTADGTAPFNMDKDGYPVSVKDGALKYTEPFELTEDMLIKQNAVWAIKIRAVAVKGTAISSNGGSAGYNVYPNNPTFSVEAGEVEKGTKVELSCIPSQAVIYYTVDGTTPTMESGLVYAEAIELTEDVTVKALAVLGQYQSSAVTAAYTVTEPEVDPVEAPVFNPAAGAVKKGTKVSIVCATEGAVIYYTVDGTEPTAESTEYKNEIEITANVTVKAIAIKGEAKSEVVEAAYTIDFTANEDEELAGVTVYPNPSNGLFNIDLPVAATIEVFASNGVLTQRVNAAAGVFTLTLDRSGIYFLRIAGEGRATVKRVVVR